MCLLTDFIPGFVFHDGDVQKFSKVKKKLNFKCPENGMLKFKAFEGFQGPVCTSMVERQKLQSMYSSICLFRTVKFKVRIVFFLLLSLLFLQCCAHFVGTRSTLASDQCSRKKKSRNVCTPLHQTQLSLHLSVSKKADYIHRTLLKAIFIFFML